MKAIGSHTHAIACPPSHMPSVHPLSLSLSLLFPHTFFFFALKFINKLNLLKRTNFFFWGYISLCQIYISLVDYFMYDDDDDDDDHRAGATLEPFDDRAMHWRWRGQVIKWSLVKPAACMNEWMTVGPTNLKPFLTMSLLMVSDFEVFTGILWHDLYCVVICL